MASPAWLNQSPSGSLETMPGLRTALAAVGEAWSASFATLSSLPTEIGFTSLETARAAESQERRPGALLAVVEAAGWDATCALRFDRLFVAAAIEALFGGEEGSEEPGLDQPPSPLELRIVESIAVQATEALTAAFGASAPTTFTVDRLLTKADLGFLGNPGDLLAVATFDLKALGRTVQCDLLIPHAVLTPLAASFTGLPSRDTRPHDASWSDKLGFEIGLAQLPLQALIEGPSMSLGAVAALHPGQVLALSAGAGQQVLLHCAGSPLFRCDLGQADGFYTLRVQDALRSPDALTAPPPHMPTDQDRAASA